MTPLELITGRLDSVKGSNGNYRARCPAHEGRNLTLSIKERQDGKAQVTCYKGCTADEITAAVGLKTRDLYPESNLTPIQRKQYAKRQTQADLETALQHELLMILQFIGKRVDSRINEKNTNFRKLRPEWRPFPDEHWEREELAAKRIVALIKKLYRESVA